MASIVEEGTQTATVGTEHTLTTTTSENPAAVKVYVVAVDCGNLANGDVVELRLYTKARGAGTLRLAYSVTYGPTVQGTPNKYSVPVVVPNGATTFRATLKQTAGTGRSFDWVVYSL